MARLMTYACMILAALIWTIALSGSSLPVALAFIAVELVFWRQLQRRRGA